MAEKKDDMCCTVRMIAALVAVMATVAAAFHLTGDIMQSGIVGVVALIYAIGLVLASCAFMHEKLLNRKAAADATS